MESRGFLITGLLSGVVAAVLALGVMWLVLFMVATRVDPALTVANIMKFCIAGVIVYPVCWYALVFRRRDYSVNRTAMLIGVTFGVVWIAAAVVMFVVGVFAAGTATATVGKPEAVPGADILTPLLYARMTILGAIILVMPYLAITTPIAFLQRFALLHVFDARPAPPVPEPAP